MASDPQRATPILSTNGRAATLVVFLVMVGYATLGRAVSRMGPVPSIEETWVPQNAVALDSAQVRGSPRAFVFQYALGAFGCSVAMVSLRKPSHLPGFLALTGSPTHVWWTSPIRSWSKCSPTVMSCPRIPVASWSSLHTPLSPVASARH